jgi:hypothetical protein
MSFGKLGAMGRGMGHLGALGGVSNPVVVSDNFLRADTVAPYLGYPTSGRQTSPRIWELHGSGFGVATDGYISGNKYVAGNGGIVYAVQRLFRPSRSIRGLYDFANAGQGTQTTFGTGATLISKESTVITNCVHVVPTRTGLSVQKIVNSVPSANLTGSWSWSTATYAPKDGSTLIPYQFDFDESGNWTALYGGRIATGTDAALPGLAGLTESYVCAEVFNSPAANLDSRAEFNGIAFGPAGGLSDVLPLIFQNNFDVSTGLTLSGCSISGGVLAFTASAGSARPTSGPAAVVGKRYLITYTITPSGFTDGSLTFSFGGASGTPRTVQGTYSDIVTAVDTSSWLITKTAGTTSPFVNEISGVQLDTF